jgi:ligand-binding sensor domain-containing protein/two-component sensor histidine kinase
LKVENIKQMRRGSIDSTLVGRAKTIAGVLARLIVLSLFTTPLAFAQLRSLDVSQYLHSSWTAQDGYFRGISGGMAQTADGYIWVLSANGLLRFDGVRFVDWKPPNGETLPGKPPGALLASRDGSLWLAGHGVVELRSDGTWHRYHELDSSSLVRLAEDKDGVIWAGVGGRPTPDSCSLFRIVHGKVECYKHPEFAGVDFSTLYVDREGRLWADSKIGIWRILPGPPKLIQKTTLPIDAFCEDSEGSLLYTLNGPIWKLSAKGKPENYLERADGTRINGRAMFRDREDGLWIGTSGEGIVHLHEGRVDHFSSFDGLSSDSVLSIFQDREGNVWAISPDSIDKFAKPAVPRLTRKQGLSSDSVLSILTDQRGGAWVGTDNGLNELGADHLIQPSPQSRNRTGSALFETHTGRLLVANLDRKQAIALDHERMVPDGSSRAWLEGYKTVFAIAEDGDGTLWAASRELGLLHLRDNGELIRAFDAEQFGDYPISVAFDPKRNGIWFTTHQGELLFLKSDKVLERYGLAAGLGYGPIRVSQLDKDGGVWVTTKVGLAHLKDGKISLLGRKNGLPCDAVHWMRHDQDHSVWLYTECGLLSFSEDDLLSWITQPSRTVTITHFLDSTEGVENNPNGGWFAPQTALTKDGRILFAMRTGLGVLDPRHLNQNALPPPVHIEGVTADGREIGNTGRTSLPAKTSAIHISYTALSFAAPRKVKFRYKLQGYDKDWSPLGFLREATYTNLPPGNYSFRVIACNNSGVWNDQGAVFDFVVLPAWYQRLWFWSLSAIAVICLLSVIFWIRLKAAERELSVRFSERITERMRIARELHDTLLQALQGLVLSVSNFTSRVSAAPEVQLEMENALQRADQLMISGRERIKDLRGELDEARDLKAELDSVAHDASPDFHPNITVSVDGVPIYLNPIAQDEILWIAKEALANACRHSGAKWIHIQVSYERNEVRVSVRDNGRGMDARASLTQHSGHFGLVGMHERAEGIGGRLSIKSTEGGGTAIGLSVPGRIAYRKKSGWRGTLTFLRNRKNLRRVL